MNIYIRLKHRFGPRQMEWFMAVIATVWGAVLIMPDQTFNSPIWEFFRTLIPETILGVIMMCLGVARITGLIINGTRQDITPWIRVVSALLGMIVWIGISYGFMLTGIISTWIAVYPAFAVAEMVNIYRAAHDAGESRNAYKH